MSTNREAAYADATGTDESAVERARAIKSVYVYEAPVRLWHWVNALSILVLAVTGYLIGSPLPSIHGEATDHFVMGTIRYAHFAAGYIMLVGFLGRIYWAFVGNHHSRELFTLPIFRKAYWNEVLTMLKWYAFLIPAPSRYVGHNPLARLAMVFGFVVLSVLMICTGFALYGEGAQAGSWAERVFGWVIPLFGSSQTVHTVHHLGLWGMVIFVTLHVYAAIREDIMGRQSMVSTMISGHRTFKQ